MQCSKIQQIESGKYLSLAGDGEKKYSCMLSVATEFADVEVHKFVNHLLKYLNQKYFSEFNVHDEGEYWETANQKFLDENFNRYTAVK